MHCGGFKVNLNELRVNLNANENTQTSKIYRRNMKPMKVMFLMEFANLHL